MTDLATAIKLANRKSDSKSPQILVQLTGILRNMAISNDQVEKLLEEGVLLSISETLNKNLNQQELT